MRHILLVSLAMLMPLSAQGGWLFGPDDEAECIDSYAKSANVGRLVPVIRQNCTEAFDLDNAEFFRARKLCEAAGLAGAAHLEIMPLVLEECLSAHADPICEPGFMIDPLAKSAGCLDVDYLAIDPYLVITRRGATWSGFGDDGVTPAKRRSERQPSEEIMRFHAIVDNMKRHPVVDKACEMVRAEVTARISGARVEIAARGGWGDVVGCSLVYSIPSGDGSAKGKQIVLTTRRNGVLYMYVVSE